MLGHGRAGVVLGRLPRTSGELDRSLDHERARAQQARLRSGGDVRLHGIHKLVVRVVQLDQGHLQKRVQVHKGAHGRVCVRAHGREDSP